MKQIVQGFVHLDQSFVCIWVMVEAKTETQKVLKLENQCLTWSCNK